MLLKEIKYPRRPVNIDPELGVNAGKYVGVYFSPETIAKIKRIIDSEEIPNAINPEDLHCTIAHSKSGISKKYTPDGDLKNPEPATIKAFKIFKTKKGGRCLVAIVDSEYLRNKHQKTLDHGAVNDFPEYIPHVTLSYNVGEDWPDSNLDKLTKKYRGTKLDISREYMTDLDPEWVKNRT